MLGDPSYYTGNLAVAVSFLVGRRNASIDRCTSMLLASRGFEVTHRDELANLMGWNRELALAVPAVGGLWVYALG